MFLIKIDSWFAFPLEAAILLDKASKAIIFRLWTTERFLFEDNSLNTIQRSGQ